MRETYPSGKSLIGPRCWGRKAMPLMRPAHCVPTIDVWQQRPSDTIATVCRNLDLRAVQCVWQAAELRHLTRLQALDLSAEGIRTDIEFHAHLDGLPETMQRLSVAAGYEQGLQMCSWPSAGWPPPPAIELFTMASLTLVDACSQEPPGCGHLAGWSVKLEAGQLTLVDTHATEQQHAGMDLAGRLLTWIAGSHAAAVILEPDLPCSGAVINVSVANRLYHDNYAVGQEDYDVESDQLLSALQQRCG